MADRPLVTVTRAGQTATITLDRPEARNALSRALMNQLGDALESADADPGVRAVILAGADRVFCAGADITEIESISASEALDPDGFARRLFCLLGSYRKPLIAAVRGAALGGGCELALACDIIIAAESATFGVPEVSLGVIPGAGGTQRLVHAAGMATAMLMLLTSTPITSADARACGLASMVVPDERCLPAAAEIAGKIARNAPLAVQLAKDAARTAHETALSQGLAHERRNFFLALGTSDAREGIRALTGKRPPAFTGR